MDNAVESSLVLRVGTFALLIETTMHRRARGACRLSWWCHDQCARKNAGQSRCRRFAVLLLAAIFARDDAEVPLAIDARCEFGHDPRALFVAERSRGTHIPAQLDTSGTPIDMLTTRAACRYGDEQ